MSSSEQYDIEFSWPSTAPKTVIATGTFDKWSSSLRLNKTSTGFEARTRVPWGEKVKYKFIVDGEWRLRDDQPTEVDYGGYVNNVVVTPPKPAAVDPSATDKQPNILNGNGNGHTTVANGFPKHANGDVKAHPDRDSEVANGKGFLSDLASTIVARDGTSSALGYVASGLGAAMHSVVGVDPINIQQIAIPTPTPDEMFKLPDNQELGSNTADFQLESPYFESFSYSPTSPVAPIVPIMIVPVNAPENNTVPRETFNPEVRIPVIKAPVDIPAGGTEPTPAIINSVFMAQDSSKEQPSSVPLVVPDGPIVSMLDAPISTIVVEEITAPAPVIEDVQGSVLVEAKSSEGLAPGAVPAEGHSATQVVEETPTPEVEQMDEAPAPAESTPVVDETKSPTPEAAVSPPKEAPVETTVAPAPESVKAEAVKEESVPQGTVTKPVATSETKPPPPVLPLASAQLSNPEPTTPTKTKFPSVSQQSSPSGSPASSKFGSTKRQKRSSILTKLKDIFHHDKEKPEKVKK